MMDSTIDVSVVVPTRDRPQALVKCIESVGRQTRPPSEVIVVDDGGTSEVGDTDLSGALDTDTAFERIASNGVPSSSTARNTGIEASTGDVVLFLDDDVVLGETYLEELVISYERNDSEQLAGIGGFDNVPNGPSTLECLFNRLFYLGTDTWRINEAGMQYPIGKRKPDLTDVTRSDWLPTNNASFKRSVLKSYRFPHWDAGREPLEDVAFGWQLKRAGYHCVLDPSLPVDHSEASDSDTLYEFGVKHGRNRVRMFRRYGRTAYSLHFLWALFGHLLRVFLAPVIDGDVGRYWSMCGGMAYGSVRELLGL